jgi:alpha-beta hydrolase superfamily lysophospholipase
MIMRRFFVLMSMLMSSVMLFAQPVEREVAVECDWAKISATLATTADGSDTAIVIVAGSGPTDRNGNSQLNLNTYSYKLLSDGLVGEGYAVLRYDKRAIGRSPIAAEDVANLVLDDFVDDAVTCVEYLRSEGYKRIFIAGHSEGGLIALIVASRGVEVDGLVLLAAPGYPMDTILRTQLSAQLMPQYAGLMLQADMALRKLKAGQRIANEDIAKELLSLFHSSVQPFLISSMQYDPQCLASGVEYPMLVVCGGNDIQVSRDNGEVIAKSAPNAKFVVFESMTHVLKDWASSDRMEQVVSVYVNSQLPLTEGLVSEISQFIKTIK